MDLDLDLEHTLDAGPSWDHPVQIWWQNLVKMALVIVICHGSVG